MSFRKMQSVGICAVVLSWAFIGNTPALASIDYGDFSATNVDYLQVTESSTTNSTALYGAPTISANAIEFAAASFGASSSGGVAEKGSGAVDVTQGDVTTTVDADNGVSVLGLQFEEAGDYTLGGTGTSATYVSVSAPVTITIEEVNGAPITPIITTTNLVFTPSSSYSLPTNAGAGVIYSGSAMVNLSNLILEAGDSGQATEVSWDLDNTLTAASESGSVALISKKAFSSNVMVEPIISSVPEPASLSLFVVALPLLAARRRRKA